MSFEHQLQPRQIARVGIEQPVGSAGGSADIAVAVEHDERIVVLQRAARPRGRARSSECRTAIPPPDSDDGVIVI